MRDGEQVYLARSSSSAAPPTPNCPGCTGPESRRWPQLPGEHLGAGRGCGPTGAAVLGDRLGADAGSVEAWCGSTRRHHHGSWKQQPRSSQRRPACQRRWGETAGPPAATTARRSTVSADGAWWPALAAAAGTSSRLSAPPRRSGRQRRAATCRPRSATLVVTTVGCRHCPPVPAGWGSSTNGMQACGPGAIAVPTSLAMHHPPSSAGRAPPSPGGRRSDPPGTGGIRISDGTVAANNQWHICGVVTADGDRDRGCSLPSARVDLRRYCRAATRAGMFAVIVTQWVTSIRSRPALT